MPTPVETLVYWCRERENIRLKKLAGEPGPWTDDEILQTYRFCNVWRREDRVSKWLCENVLTEANIDYDLRSFLMFSAWCRFVNWPPTIQAAMEEGFYPKKRIDWKKLGRFTDNLGRLGQKVWTGAYMIRAPKKAGMWKGKFVSEVVIGTNFKKVLPALVKQIKPQPGGQASYYSVWETLRTINGYGSFYAGQIAGDWTYTPLLDEAKDLTTFAPLGPGSVRGFNRLMGITPITKRPSWDLWLEKLAEWRALIVDELTMREAIRGMQPPDTYEKLSALDVQNCLCETDKYLRVLSGEGRPRAKYTPHTY
jgi:hypothetical protein